MFIININYSKLCYTIRKAQKTVERTRTFQKTADASRPPTLQHAPSDGRQPRRSRAFHRKHPPIRPVRASRRAEIENAAQRPIYGNFQTSNAAPPIRLSRA
ncbi:unnamed protein product, partial [Iphiclides podalirius]